MNRVFIRNDGLWSRKYRFSLIVTHYYCIELYLTNHWRHVSFTIKQSEKMQMKADKHLLVQELFPWKGKMLKALHELIVYYFIIRGVFGWQQVPIFLFKLFILIWKPLKFWFTNRILSHNWCKFLRILTCFHMWCWKYIKDANICGRREGLCYEAELVGHILKYNCTFA